MKVAKLNREILRRGGKYLAEKDNDIKRFIRKYGLPDLPIFIEVILLYPVKNI